MFFLHKIWEREHKGYVDWDTLYHKEKNKLNQNLL